MMADYFPVLASYVGTGIKRLGVWRIVQNGYIITRQTGLLQLVFERHVEFRL